MSVAEQPPATEVLPHKKTYDQYIRIVEPGRHVFRTRFTLGRGFMATFGICAAVFMVRMGFLTTTMRHGHDAGSIAFACYLWLLALSFVAILVLGVRRGTAVEITPGNITIKQRRLLRWRTSESPISDFSEAILEGRPEFNYGGRSVQLIPRLVFFDDVAFSYFDKASWMSAPFYSQEEADDFVRDLNASAERARRAPETF
jgi:hypothetical protein